MATASAFSRSSASSGLGKRVLAGAAGGIAGGVVFGNRLLGMPLFAVDLTAMMSLVGHLIYGAILGLVAVRIMASRT